MSNKPQIDIKRTRASRCKDEAQTGKSSSPATKAGEQNRSTKKAKITILEQWVEVRIFEGRTVTTLYPSNTQLTKEKKRMKPEPTLVYRRFHFPDGIPPEYAWTAPASAERRGVGGCGVQRMTTETWEEVIEREAHNEDEHVGPTGVGNLPRPKERGGCSCAVCNAFLEDGDEEGSDLLQEIVPEPGSACHPKKR